MFNTLPTTADALRGKTWADLQPYYDELTARPLTADSIAGWLTDWTSLGDLIGEYGSRLHVATTRDTADAAAEALLRAFYDDILPHAEPAENILKQRLLESGLEPDGMAIPLRNMRAEVGLFRDTNIPVQTEISNLRISYNKVLGAQTVTWDGSEKTLRQLEPLLQSDDRTVREQVWRAISERQLADREPLGALWKQFLGKRRQLAANAGHPDYRAYAWVDRLRFDYTPDDSLRFLDAIEAVVVPAVTQLHERRRQQMGINSVRPWDLSVDPLGRQPLRPFADVAELEDRAGAIFDRLDPELSHYYATMREEDLLDLGNRKNKGPGGYCTHFPLSKRPFIFMNAVGLQGDIRTLVHEAGHAFHAYEKFKLPYAMQREVTAEYNEVASMAMEMLTMPFWGRAEGGYYEPADADRARVEHLEKILQFWPYMAVVDGFQHWVYTHPDAAADLDACDAAWTALEDRFQPSIDMRGLEQDKAHGWQRKLHIFLYPFYYVDYGMAQVGALQIWGNMRKDQPSALAAYKRGLALGGTASLPELYATSGAEFRFDEDTLGRAVGLISEALAGLR